MRLRRRELDFYGEIVEILDWYSDSKINGDQYCTSLSNFSNFR
jgi:hypothetical protein